MITLHVALTVRESSQIESVANLLAEHSRLSRAEAGCMRFELFQSREDPATFFIVEEWESPEVLDTHRAATSFTTIYLPQVLPLVERRAEEILPVRHG